MAARAWALAAGMLLACGGVLLSAARGEDGRAAEGAPPSVPAAGGQVFDVGPIVTPGGGYSGQRRYVVFDFSVGTVAIIHLNAYRSEIRVEKVRSYRTADPPLSAR